MEIIKIQPKNRKQLDALKAMLKAFEIPFEKAETLAYDSDFVDKIQKSEKEEKDSVVLKSENEIEDYFNNL